MVSVVEGGGAVVTGRGGPGGGCGTITVAAAAGLLSSFGGHEARLHPDAADRRPAGRPGGGQPVGTAVADQAAVLVVGQV